MLTFYSHNKIDKTKWDNCIHSSLNSSVYVTSWFLDIVCEDWVALINDDYRAVFPLAVKNRYGIRILYQPFFCRYLGVYSPEPISEALTNEFLKAIPSDYKFIEFNLNEANKPSVHHFELTQRQFQRLDLDLDYEKIWEKFKAETKRVLKKAERDEFIVKFNSISNQEVVNHFKLTKGAELSYFKPKDYKRLEELMNFCTTADRGLAVSLENKTADILVVAYFITYNHTLYLLQNSVSIEARKKGAMYFLLDVIFKKYAGHFKYFDFGGSNIKGVADFNRNFGGTNQTYLRVKKDNSPIIVKVLKKVLGK